MTGFDQALPGVPEEALRTFPVLATPEARRRYGRAATFALAGLPSWEIEVWSRRGCPPLLRMRALQEDWPMIGTGRRVAIVRPAPWPGDELPSLVEVPAGFQEEAVRVLGALLVGEVAQPSVELAVALAEALGRAARVAFTEARAAARSEGGGVSQRAAHGPPRAVAEAPSNSR
jgi:hypothetical protein